MNWIPLSQSNVVGLLSGATERAILDFKLTYDLGDRRTVFEIAKDIAAFANRLGGTILVGAVEANGKRRGRIAVFRDVENAGDLTKAVDRAAKMCRPVPVVDSVPVVLEQHEQTSILGREVTGAAVELVAINIQPLLATPIGSPVCSPDDDAGKPIAEVYRFPVRTVEGTRFLRPEELAFYMNSPERRTLVELWRLSPPDRKKVRVWCYQPGGQTQGLRRPVICELAEVDAESLAITLIRKPEDVEYRARVPMVFIRAVWFAEERWNLSIEGSVFVLKSDGRSRGGFVPLGASVD